MKKPSQSDLAPDKNRQDAAGSEFPKKKYSAPRVVEYGSFAKLTRGGAGGTAEGGMSPCL